MDDTWILRGVECDTLVDWLHELAALARSEQRAMPHRPQPPLLAARELPAGALPLPLRCRARRAAAIYDRLPAPDDPFGHILVLLLAEPVAGTDALGSGIVRVEIASDPGFPLRGDEVRYHFRARFAGAQRGARGRRTHLLVAANRAHGRFADCSAVGAPVLDCNLWLEEQIAAHGYPARPLEPEARRRLFRPWLQRYHAARGCDPSDPTRSFRAAVAACERRLRRRVHRGGQG